MISPSLRRSMATILGCLLAGLFLSLPVCAIRSDAPEKTAMSDIETSSEPPPATSVTGGQTEQDPMHATAEAPTRSGGWLVAALCVLVAVSVLLIIVAMIPNRRK